jgi:hypothetical protein
MRVPALDIVIVLSAHDRDRPPLSVFSVVTAEVSTGTPLTVKPPDTFVAPNIRTLPVDEVSEYPLRLTFATAGAFAQPDRLDD